MITGLLIRLIKFYQLFSKNIPLHHCRFYPTCSDYCILVLQKYKYKGLLKCFFRILKCNPLFKGGIDLP